MTDQAFLSVFTPSRTSPEDLEAIFVQRQDLLADAVERVRESAMTGNKHHLLFVGPRGTGKTHLVTLLVHRVSQDRELTDKLRIAWLNEDETSTTFLEFLRRIYLALTKRYPDEYREAYLEPIYDQDANSAEQTLAALLLQHLQDRTLLVVVENLDALFEGLGEPGQKRLRAFIQENPVLSIVATAQRLVDELTKRNKVFFGFFQTESLITLTVEEAAELLAKIARLNRQPDAAAFLNSPVGHARIQALHHLSGGNHRVYIVLSQFITRDNLDALVVPFAKMIDEMTPYYQERIRWLPAQQRKIVEHLCTRERPVPVKELARRLFASQQTISSQLMDLRNKGYVQSAQRGRESLYEIAEPLMRICVEIKENQSPGPMRLLVDFLRVWYDERVLSSRLQACEDGSLGKVYLQAAIERNAKLGNLRVKLLLDGYRHDLGEERGKYWLPHLESYAEESEELLIACGEWTKGHDKEALCLLAEIADEKSKQPVSVRASAYQLAGWIHYERKEFELAIQTCDMILALPDAPVAAIARAIYNRGVTYGELGQTEQEIADFSAVIGLANAPVGYGAMALYGRGWVYGQIGKTEQAIADYSAVIVLAGAPAGQVANALYNRGLAYWNLNDLEHAAQDFEAGIALQDAPMEKRVDAHLVQTQLYLITGRWDSAITTLKAGLALGQGWSGFATPTATFDVSTGSQNVSDGVTTPVTPSVPTLGRGNENLKPYTGDSSGIIQAFFDSSLNPAIRHERAAQLAQVYQQYNALASLGEALIVHLGRLHRDLDKLPAADNLEQWAVAWEEAGRGMDGLRLPLRIFRTGVDFLKTGGKDRGVLLDLNQEERRILEQALGLGDGV